MGVPVQVPACLPTSRQRTPRLVPWAVTGVLEADWCSIATQDLPVTSDLSALQAQRAGDTVCTSRRSETGSERPREGKHVDEAGSTPAMASVATEKGMACSEKLRSARRHLVASNVDEETQRIWRTECHRQKYIIKDTRGGQEMARTGSRMSSPTVCAWRVF